MTPRRFFLCLTTLLLSGHATAAQVPGRTEASYSVSFNGESNYSVPLWTPPGIKGIQPSLALVYSSNGGAGHFGAGWSLSGLTSIHRCQKTWIQDGIARDVRNDSSDRFCLDGNQLKLVSGTYGSAGSIYQTEIETFSRITAYSAAGNGPAYFIVEGRDGLYYEYGRTPNSMIESLGQTTARAWLINKVSDRNDNAMLISYSEDATNGSYRVSSIQYTQNTTAGVLADYAVEFVYQSVPVAEVDSQYLAGSKVKRVMRADRIDVKASGSVVRRYELTYEASLSTTSKSRLASIQECGVAATNCFAPTNFTYCAAPPDLRDRDSDNYLAPSADFLPQVSHVFERSLDRETLGQIRGLPTGS